VASYQRENRKEQARKAQREKKMDRRERFEQAVREREQKKRDIEQRWSRREETDFYKVRH
jgi:chromodomain helicase DNA binding protein 8